MPLEESGQDWCGFAYGENWRRHAEFFATQHARVLMRDNPGLDPALREQQAQRSRWHADRRARPGALVSSLAVPGPTTTVLTSASPGSPPTVPLPTAPVQAGRRLAARASMLTPAVLGAALQAPAGAIGPRVGTRAGLTRHHPTREVRMTVERTHAGHQTRYAIRDSAGFCCALTYTAAPDEPATWKVLLPGPGGTEDLYGTERFRAPDATQLGSLRRLAHRGEQVPADGQGRTWELHVCGVTQAGSVQTSLAGYHRAERSATVHRVGGSDFACTDAA